MMLPILVRAMVASDDRLFVLGPEELMRQDEIKQRITEDEVQQLMAEQEKALNGESGSILLSVDKQSGKILSGLPAGNRAAIGRHGRCLRQFVHLDYRRATLLPQRATARGWPP